MSKATRGCWITFGEGCEGCTGTGRPGRGASRDPEAPTQAVVAIGCCAALCCAGPALTLFASLNLLGRRCAGMSPLRLRWYERCRCRRWRRWGAQRATSPPSASLRTTCRLSSTFASARRVREMQRQAAQPAARQRGAAGRRAAQEQTAAAAAQQQTAAPPVRATCCRLLYTMWARRQRRWRGPRCWRCPPTLSMAWQRVPTALARCVGRRGQVGRGLERCCCTGGAALPQPAPPPPLPMWPMLIQAVGKPHPAGRPHVACLPCPPPALLTLRLLSSLAIAVSTGRPHLRHQAAGRPQATGHLRGRRGRGRALRRHAGGSLFGWADKLGVLLRCSQAQAPVSRTGKTVARRAGRLRAAGRWGKEARPGRSAAASRVQPNSP